MPRPIEFEPERVLKSAMLEFWENGYKTTSMRDISACTGLQPGSLYLAYQDKRNLFIEALDLYINQRKEFIKTILEPMNQHCLSFKITLILSSKVRYQRMAVKVALWSILF